MGITHLQSKKVLFFGLFLLNIGIIIELGFLFHSFRLSPTDAASVNKQVDETARLLESKCENEGQVCYSLAFRDITKSHSLPFVLKTLEQLQTLDPTTRGCHLIAHSISAAETEKNPSDWLALLRSMDVNQCSGGLLHGVIETHSGVDKSFVLNGKLINETCDYVAKNKGGGVLNCAHIMGHIALAQRAGNISQAVDLCGEVESKLQYECYSGIFMENETRDNLIAHNIAEKIPWNEKTTQAQEVICKSYSGDQAKACWREVAHLYVFISRNDPTEVSKLCQNASVADGVRDCYFHALGIMGSLSTWDPSKNKVLCEPYKDDLETYKQCAQRFIGSLMASSLHFAPQAVQFCITIDTSSTQSCLEYLSKIFQRDTYKNNRAELCKLLPPQYAKTCDISK